MDTVTPPALLPYEVEAEQRRVYDRRVAAWPVRIAGIVIGVLWLMQLAGQLPWNNFVKPPSEVPNGLVTNGNVTADQPGPFVDNGAGLYHQFTLMAQYGNKGPLSGYGSFITSAVLPRWQFVGWVLFVLEGLVAAGLVLGILSKLAGFFCFLLGLFFFFGLAQVPGGWVWSYALLALFGFVFMITGPGRFFGVDQLLRTKLREMITRDSTAAKMVYLLPLVMRV